MLQALRDHQLFCLIVVASALVFSLLPLQLQSFEAYSYAASIEQYYNLSTTFALAQGENLPDFGRYHLNHPLGHLIAGIMYDVFRIPALSWMRFTNIAATLCSGAILYFLAMRLRFSKDASLLAMAFFLATNASLLAVSAGEWHMPSLALGLAGTWKVTTYLRSIEKRDLISAAVFFFLGIWYHTAGLSLTVCVGVALLLVRRKHWRTILATAAISGVCVLFVYFVVPFMLFKFETIADFWRSFFMYKYLMHARYGIMDWLFVGSQTLFHSMIYMPATMPLLNWIVFPSILAICLAGWSFHRCRFDMFTKLLFLFILVGWPGALAIVGSRANAVNGWIFMLPFLSLILVRVIAIRNKYCRQIVNTLPVLILAWNLCSWVLPNHRYLREEIFLFDVPSSVSTKTPVAFVTNELVTTMSEIWNAGSNLGFKNQSIYYPCCGEDSFALRLRRWLRENPGSIIVSDFAATQMEQFLRSMKLNYVRWVDRSVSWPNSLLPATLYFKREPGYHYRKHLTVWIPADKVGLP